jgi:hypothetical protein
LSAADAILAVANQVPVPLVRECATQGDFERAAALCMLHGFVDVAVQVLSLAAEDARHRAASASSATLYGLSDASQSQSLQTQAQFLLQGELLQLTVMAVAGCPGAVSDSAHAAAATATATFGDADVDANRSVWLSSCRALLLRIDPRRHPYLRMIITILVEVAEPDMVDMAEEADPAGVPDHSGQSHSGHSHSHGNCEPDLRDALAKQEAVAVAREEKRRFRTQRQSGAHAADSSDDDADAQDHARANAVRDAEAAELAEGLGLGGGGAGGGFGADRAQTQPRGGHQAHPHHRSHHHRHSHSHAHSHGSPHPSQQGALGRRGPRHHLDTLQASSAAVIAAAAAAAAAASTAGDKWGSSGGEESGMESAASQRRRQSQHGATERDLGTDLARPSPIFAASSVPQHPAASTAELSALEQLPASATATSAPGFEVNWDVGDGTAPAAGDAEEHIEISLPDRIAFACRFLDDSHLPAYISMLTEEVVTAGRMDGLLLTGFTPLGARLTQRFLDNSADVQTTGLVGCYMLRAAQLYMLERATEEGMLEEEAQQGDGAAASLRARLAALCPEPMARMVTLAWRWLQSYRELLSRLQLWHERATFDVMRSRLLNVQHRGYVPSVAALAATGAVSARLSATDIEREAVEVLLGFTGYTNINTNGTLTGSSAVGGGGAGASASASVVGSASVFGGPVAATAATVPGSDAKGGSVLAPSQLGGKTSASAFQQQQSQAGGAGGALAAVREVANFIGYLGLTPPKSMMYVRCASCKTSLSLPSLVEQSASAIEWLSKQRPHMLSCPSCKKSLPRCSLCLLPLGCINPVMQLQHEMRQRNAARTMARVNPSSQSAEENADDAELMGDDSKARQNGISTTAKGKAILTNEHGIAPFDAAPAGQLRDAMSFDDFWCWCQSCHHGGHASHLAEWFSSQTICPVAGCMCHCAKVDGITRGTA